MVRSPAMRFPLFVLAVGFAANIAEAASPVQGRWEIVMPSHPAFSGELVVDEQGRATFSGRMLGDPRTGQSRGYVSRAADTRVEFTLANEAEVVRIKCTIQSQDTLNCDDVATGRGLSNQYYMRRIGPGPTSLLPQ